MELHKEQLCVYLDVMASADEVRLSSKNAALKLAQQGLNLEKVHGVITESLIV